jgi:hypothetical protein
LNSFRLPRKTERLRFALSFSFAQNGAFALCAFLVAVILSGATAYFALGGGK